jgi:hypothetical protein
LLVEQRSAFGFISAAPESSQARATKASGKETPIDAAVFMLRDQIVPVARFCDITHGTRDQAIDCIARSDHNVSMR